MKLIIAEKPSLGRNIADAIGNLTRQNGYLQGDDYIVTWVFGHLFSLADIEYYKPKTKKRWTFENIPCFPEQFAYELGGDDGVKRQFALIQKLCNREDVDTIINAGDADREGEIIVRTTVQKALKGAKPLYRLWLPDQTKETIRAQLDDLKPDAEYDHLADEGYARTYIDWLYGVNLTRYASILTGKLLRVGRVIVPIVKAIYDRDLAIRNFVATTYYGVASKTTVDGEEVLLTSKKEFSQEELQEAEVLARTYNAQVTKVTDRKSHDDFLPAPKLYSLSTLQNVLGKKYKMSMKESLDVIQGLYEKGFLTYPRTNSEYLATAEKGKIKTILANIQKLGYDVTFRDSKYIFDDSKIESHSALTPTYKIPGPSDLSAKEKDVYSTVLRRFVAVFCREACKVERTQITVQCGDLEEFVLKGTILLQPGWTKYDDYTKKDKILPNLQVGQVIPTAFAPVEKQTTAPKHYTIETLNNYLKNPFREEKASLEETSGESDEEDYRAIFEGLELGTEATRTGIIDNARTSKYIDLQKDVYTILPDGEYLIEALSQLGISMDKYKTSEMGRALKRVYRGELSVKGSTDLAQVEIEEIFSHKDTVLKDPADNIPDGTNVGACPICGAPVLKEGRFYPCDGAECTFRLPAILARKVLPLEAVMTLICTGHTPPIEGFVSKKGTLFTAPLKLEEGHVSFDLDDPLEGQPVPDCKCPKCGKKMLYSRFTYVCSVKKCGFSVQKTILGHAVTEEELRLLGEEGVTPRIEDFKSKKDGSLFSGYITFLDGESRLAWRTENPQFTKPKEYQESIKATRKAAAPKKKEEPQKAEPPKPEPQPIVVVGRCPKCGYNMVRGRANWGCLGFSSGCQFRIPFQLAEDFILEDDDIRRLLKTGNATCIRGDHSAELYITGNGDLKITMI